MINFNDHLENGVAFKRSFPGCTASELKYYVQPAINENNPDCAVICVGTNNLTKKIQTAKEIAEEIVDVART